MTRTTPSRQEDAPGGGVGGLRLLGGGRHPGSVANRRARSGRNELLGQPRRPTRRRRTPRVHRSGGGAPEGVCSARSVNRSLSSPAIVSSSARHPHPLLRLEVGVRRGRASKQVKTRNRSSVGARARRSVPRFPRLALGPVRRATGSGGSRPRRYRRPGRRPGTRRDGSGRGRRGPRASRPRRRAPGPARPATTPG